MVVENGLVFSCGCRADRRLCGGRRGRALRVSQVIDLAAAQGAARGLPDAGGRTGGRARRSARSRAAAPADPPGAGLRVAGPAGAGSSRLLESRQLTVTLSWRAILQGASACSAWWSLNRGWCLPREPGQGPNWRLPVADGSAPSVPAISIARSKFAAGAGSSTPSDCRASRSTPARSISSGSFDGTAGRLALDGTAVPERRAGFLRARPAARGNGRGPVRLGLGVPAGASSLRVGRVSAPRAILCAAPVRRGGVPAGVRRGDHDRERPQADAGERGDRRAGWQRRPISRWPATGSRSRLSISRWATNGSAAAC